MKEERSAVPEGGALGCGKRRPGRFVDSIVPAVLLVLTAMALFLFAQIDMTRRESGGWGPGSAYSRLFDPAAVETVSGEVVGRDAVVPVEGMLEGWAVTVRSDGGRMSRVHLGPVWYLGALNTRVLRRDRVTVTGSRVRLAGRPVVMATEVRIEGVGILRLRAGGGRPVWGALVPT